MLPNRMIRILKNGVHAGLALFGYFLERREGSWHIRRRITLGTGDYIDVIEYTCGTPNTAFVVGAFQGAGVIHILKAFPNIRVYVFEPDPDTFTLLNQNLSPYPNAKTVQAAVGETDNEVQLHRNRNPDTNSLLPLSESLMAMRTDERITVHMTTIDEYCSREGVDSIDYLHSDLQGYELNMLRGARNMLAKQKIKLLLLEVCFDPTYVGQSKFEDIYAFLSGFGYRFVCTQGMFFEENMPYPRGGNVVFVAPQR